MRFKASQNRRKINEKSIKKWRQDGDSSWHRFIMDFHRFSEASWSEVGIKNRQKIDAKNIQKMMANKRPLKASLKRLGVVLADLNGVIQRAGDGRGWIVRPPKSRFFKTDQAPLERGKCLGLGNGKGLRTGKHKHMGKGKDTGQVGRIAHSRRRAKRGGGYSSIL